MKKINNIFLIFIFCLIIVAVLAKVYTPGLKNSQVNQAVKETHPLMINVLRSKDYPGSEIIIEQTLSSGVNYNQYIASYRSEGLKIYGLLTIPEEVKPEKGWPVIIFNHGYIRPGEYKTTQRYVAYVDAFAKAGYIVFKPDYRGHGFSEGQPEGGYYSPAYTEDVLNALSSLKRYKDASPGKIGMWGHSMGGNLTLRSLVVDPTDIKAAVIWGGAVGTYDDLMNNWQRRVSYSPPPNELALRNRYRQNLISKYGTPKNNPGFWNSIDPNFFLQDITAPIQLHTGAADEEVPPVFSQDLFNRLKKLKKEVEFFSYPNGDHNIAEPNFSLAIQRSIDFFDKYLKSR